MKKKWIVIGVSALIVLFIGINIWKSLGAKAPEVETATLQEENMKETVITPGTLKLNDEQYIYFQPERGEIAEVHVEEGDEVEKGDKLLSYQNDQLELEQEQNELQIRSTSLNLENVRKKHRDIDKELEKDEDNEMLQQEHDQIKLEQQMTNIELEQLNLQKESIASQLEELTITADVDGTVLSIHEEIDSLGQMAEESIMRIGTLNDVIVEGSLSEFDTLNIAEGQDVILTSEAVPDKEWKGSIRFISDLPKEAAMEFDQQDTSVEYPIRVAIEDEINLKPGFRMLIEIITREEKINTLPINAILQEDDMNYVYVVEDGKVKRKEVKIGSVDSEKMEITEGITSEDQVIVHPSDEISEGTEVTIQ